MQIHEMFAPMQQATATSGWIWTAEAHNQCTSVLFCVKNFVKHSSPWWSSHVWFFGWLSLLMSRLFLFEVPGIFVPVNFQFSTQLILPAYLHSFCRQSELARELVPQVCDWTRQL